MSEVRVPQRIRVGYGEDGFWSCADAMIGSPEFIRADIAIVADAATIDRAAKYLRETYRKGQILNDWATLPKSAKKKWIALATGLFAAVSASPEPQPEGRKTA